MIPPPCGSNTSGWRNLGGLILADAHPLGFRGMSAVGHARLSTWNAA